MSKEKLVENNLTLITTEGYEIIIEYKLEEYADDYVLEEVREGIQNHSILCLDDEVAIKFNGNYIDELDCRKIIGIRWP